jgi:hypothetical protein
VDSAATYPVRVEARLDAPLSRWLWLVKWALIVPHYIALVFAWLAFGVLSVLAFFAILFTGQYPRAIFEFNVGVLRCTWRVRYYWIGLNRWVPRVAAYAGLMTDRYPPFRLDMGGREPTGEGG